MVNGVARKKVMLGESLKDWMGPDLKLWAQFRNTSIVHYWTIQYEWTPKKIVYKWKEGNEDVLAAGEQPMWGIRQCPMEERSGENKRLLRIGE